MSLLTPERVPVKVYKWDDVGAPALDKTAGCVANIFKACLVTGYDTKEPAGWSMPFEDANVKVLRPEVGPHTDFHLRLSADTGTEMTAQVYLNMTDSNTGDLKLQCDTPFKYAKRNSTGKWVIVASPRGFWFFCDQRYSGSASKTGAYFYCGDIAPLDSSSRLTYLQHTGGTYTDGDYSSIFGVNASIDSTDKASTRFVSAKILDAQGVVTNDVFALVNGSKSLSNDDAVVPVLIIVRGKVYILSGAYAPFNGSTHNNFDIVNINRYASVINAINHGTGGRSDSNLYIATDDWRF